ncbi:MAG TPA: hypothetical protein VJH03_04495 [Blastocatellia bacterium]|nr:hypothetical protein [Blastocatellia bacterium]
MKNNQASARNLAMPNKSPLLHRGGVVALLFIIITSTGCSRDRAAAKAAIEDHLKDQGVVEMKLDLFYTNSQFPDKAYASATVTFNFATADGSPQKGHMGFVLQRQQDGWKVEKSEKYTTDEGKANTVLSGKKI